jgi:hypothetical protein
MPIRVDTRIAFATVAAVAVMSCAAPTPDNSPPHFHHLHLNSADPGAAIDYYARAFSTVTKTKVAGFDGFTTTSRLSSHPGNILVLFNSVAQVSTPATAGQSAVAHFGWNVPDARAYLGKFQTLKLSIVPMFADGRGTTVAISSDALPGYLTEKQIADAAARGVKPAGRGGFLYTDGPDGALIESYGDFPKERFTHIHMYHRHPVCAQQWYARHLGADVAATHLHLGPGQDVAAEEAADDCRKPYAEATYPAFGTEGRIREPSGYVLFDDIGLPIWPHPGELVSTRGQNVDHIALSVQNLGAALDRLRHEGVAVLQDAHDWGGTRAAIVEGPDRLALELIEAR